MSADNWAVCPRCLAKAVKAHMLLTGEIKGNETMSPDVKRLALSAIPDVDPEDYRTWREDYEFSGVTTGWITASYSGSCTECGLSADFTSLHDILLPREEKDLVYLIPNVEHL